VDLLLAEASGPYGALVSSEVRIINFNKGRILASLPSLVHYLNKDNPYVILSAMTHTNIVALLAAKIARAKTKVVVSQRNAMNQANHRFSQLRRPFMNFLIKVCYPWSHAITTVSHGVSNDLIKLLPKEKDKIFTIYNPVLTPDIYEKMEEVVDHPWINTREKDTKIILAAGRLNVQKDFETLIRSVALVRKQVNVKLIILGKGELQFELEKLIQSLGLINAVDLHGFVDNPFKFMKKADLFVLSSKWEGLPGVLIQAMACGTPVISTDCPHGPSEILENGKWGNLVPVSDVRVLATSILDSLNAKEHPSVMSRAKHFTLDQSVSKYLNVLGVASKNKGK